MSERSHVSTEKRLLSEAVKQYRAKTPLGVDDSEACVQFCAALSGFEGGSDSSEWFYTQFPRFDRMQTRQFAVFAAVIAEAPEKSFHKTALELSGLRWGQVYGMMQADTRFRELYNTAIDSRQCLCTALLMERVIATAEEDCARVTVESDANGNVIKKIRTTDPRTLLDVLSRFDRNRFGDNKNGKGDKNAAGAIVHFAIERVPKDIILEERKQEREAHK